MRDKSRSRAVRVFLLCHHSSFWDKQGPAQLQGCCKATRKNEPSYLPTECSNGAEIRLHRRASHSAAGRPSGAKEKDSRTVEMRRLCVHDLLQQTEQRENSTRHIAAQSERAKMFQDRLSPFSACLRGTHSIMRRIWADTSHSRSIAGVEEGEGGGGGGGWIIQPASAARLWRLVFYGEVRRAGNNNKQHLLTWQPGDTASKEPRFSRGQGIISESSSRIIAPSQNDTRRCGTPSQIAGLSLPTHRMKWQPCPADSKASEPE